MSVLQNEEIPLAGKWRFVVTWQSIPDKRRCKICEALHGYTWIFEDALPPVIQHPKFGVVWNVELDTSMAHEFPIPSIHCRCQLIVETEIEMASISETKKEIEELSKGMREYIVISHMIGMPPEISQALISVRRLKFAMNELNRATTEMQVLGAIGIQFALLYGTRIALDIFLKVTGLEPSERWKAWQKQQQQDLETWQMMMRRQKY